ncbi:hypothetical protein BLNAU_11855 [Blattamonas nauphoetae]|uniref:Uncharacterized protein n=1 Tax=Blattamonas nauphoetae TaxID=2049346 RepID=A0ABQ9XQU0_9EUKA|nr:hypothetical protein BLNAU_11855 [Blattamonas nauphoetae]
MTHPACSSKPKSKTNSTNRCLSHHFSIACEKEKKRNGNSRLRLPVVSSHPQQNETEEWTIRVESCSHQSTSYVLQKSTQAHSPTQTTTKMSSQSQSASHSSTEEAHSSDQKTERTRDGRVPENEQHFQFCD